jgi:hypothetical protein
VLRENFCNTICLILGGARVENSGVNYFGFPIQNLPWRNAKNLKIGRTDPLKVRQDCHTLKRPMFFVLAKWQEHELYEFKVNTGNKRQTKTDQSLFGAELRSTDGC